MLPTKGITTLIKRFIRAKPLLAVFRTYHASFNGVATSCVAPLSTVMVMSCEPCSTIVGSTAASRPMLSADRQAQWSQNGRPPLGKTAINAGLMPIFIPWNQPEYTVEDALRGMDDQNDRRHSRYQNFPPGRWHSPVDVETESGRGFGQTLTSTMSRTRYQPTDDIAIDRIIPTKFWPTVFMNFGCQFKDCGFAPYFIPQQATTDVKCLLITES